MYAAAIPQRPGLAVLPGAASALGCHASLPRQCSPASHRRLPHLAVASGLFLGAAALRSGAQTIRRCATTLVPQKGSQSRRVRCQATTEETEPATAEEEAAVQEAEEEVEEEATFQRRVPFDPSAQPGAMLPLGYFDPLGFCPPGDQSNFRKLRAAELKHGRVAMMASVGLLVQSLYRLPILGLRKAPTGFYAFLKNPVNKYCSVLLCFIAVVELLIWRQDTAREPGDFGDPLKLKMYDREMREREINNGRMAMFSAAGMIAAELVTGKDAIHQLGLDIKLF